MKYRFFLLLFVIALHGINPAFAQDTRYRVELLVLTHLQHDSEPMELLQLEDFSTAIDFLTPSPEEDEEQEAEATSTESMAAEALVNSTESPPDPNALEHIEEMSDVMRESWRRLQQSGPFRPEQHLSWEQGEQEPFPILRVHDLEVVLVDDPYAGLSQSLAGQAVVIDGTEETGIPDSILYYRLDGTAVLRRTRFLHLDLNLQLREAVREETSLPPLSSIIEPAGQEPPQTAAFRVHSLMQSRQVKSGRMEYFDGPVLSVLVFITAIGISDGEAP